jgi:hypothetical protein
VDNELSNINSWREVYEKDEAALRPSKEIRQNPKIGEPKSHALRPSKEKLI